MKVVLLLISIALFIFVLVKFIKHKSLYPFMPFRYDFRKRRDSFNLTLDLLKQKNAKLLIETGTSREGLKGTKSNGSATVVFGKWVKENNAHLHSVDISKDSIDKAKKAIEKLKLEKNIQFHLSDSVKFLKEFNEPVDFLYLDSYDYSDDIEVQQASQKHHLNEFKAIENMLHENSFVLIDDCNLPNGGKGKMVIEYMLSKNWQIKWKGYQVLLTRNKKTTTNIG